mmetsp:Transcript_14049/g.38644  ORF Transcript_14049/g.38644 Transcript_14049/m.38644 type:complete len:228 (+) Transcript_14049:476-1159(+)
MSGSLPGSYRATRRPTRCSSAVCPGRSPRPRCRRTCRSSAPSGTWRSSVMARASPEASASPTSWRMARRTRPSRCPAATRSRAGRSRCGGISAAAARCSAREALPPRSSRRSPRASSRWQRLRPHWPECQRPRRLLPRRPHHRVTRPSWRGRWGSCWQAARRWGLWRLRRRLCPVRRPHCSRPAHALQWQSWLSRSPARSSSRSRLRCSSEHRLTAPRHIDRECNTL